MIRAFVGLPLAEALVAPLEALQEGLPLGRPVPGENLHLTLAFLGEQDAPTLEELHYGLETLAGPGGVLTLPALAAWGGRTARVVVAEATATEELRRLNRKVRSLAHGAGIVLPRQRFRPHVTLARIGAGATPEATERLRTWLAARGALHLPAMPVREVALYSSTLRPDGAVYEVLARYPLAPVG